MSESEIWINQKKINGRLCQVDWRLISALKEVVAALRAAGPNEVHVNNAELLINQANVISEAVAIPDPPGCDPFNRKADPPIS
ncbi:MAG TPA: hypothetical protein VEW46_17265 [Pyrinomonadaceae bacterium]|nr:hypothetical protein [Pyrinomonadaceae bacterium]